MASLVPGLFAPSPTSWYTKRVERLSCTVVGTNTEGSAKFKAQGATPKDGYGRRCECLDLYKELVPYEEARSWQKYIVQRRHTLVEREIDHSDILILLQHPPLYTLGTGSSEEYLNFNIKDPPYDVYRSERGGEVTYHGPGQLVMYPIINLRYHKMDLHWYLRSLEEVVIQVLSKTFSLKASRLEGLTGVWIGNQKVAAIGVRVSRWITFHGLALNVTTDLKPFEHIVPCGIRDKQVGSIAELLGISSGGITAEDASQLMDIAHESLLKEFSEVFQVALQLKPNLSNANGSDLSVDNSTRIVSESIGIRLSS